MKKIILFNALCVVAVLGISGCSAINNSNTQVVCYQQLDTTSNCPFDNKNSMNCTGKWTAVKQNKLNHQYGFICVDRKKERLIRGDRDDAFILGSGANLLNYYLDTNNPSLTTEDFEIIFTQYDPYSKYTHKQARELLNTPVDERWYLTMRQYREQKEPIFKELPKETQQRVVREMSATCGNNCTIKQTRQIVDKYKGKK